jgi:AraC-like DNA-binding protein
VSHTQATAFRVGQLTECLIVEDSASAHVMGVRFKPAGTSLIVPFDLSEIQNEEITLECLWGSTGRSLQDDLINAKSDDERMRLFESFLLRRSDGGALEPRIAEAVTLIERKQGRIAVTEISERVGWSARQLERQFLWRIGLGPKAFSRTIRFQTLLQIAKSGSRPDWAALALDCGFFDQAHLIREFKRFSGEPPEVFLGQGYTLYEFFALYEAMTDFSNTRDVLLQ